MAKPARPRKSDPACRDYHVTRRRFLQFGGLGVATLLGMPVRDLMAASDQAKADWASGSARPGAYQKATAEHVILLWMGGGMSHIDTWDPKPGRPTAGEFKPIKTSASGVEISEILPHTATQMKHASLVRSITARNGDHGGATYTMMTGYAPAPQFTHPAMGSIVVHEREQIGELPAFVSVNGRAGSAGYLGHKHEAYFIGAPGQPDPYLSLHEGVTQARAERRMALLREANAKFEAAKGDPSLGAIDQSYAAAVNFMNSPALKALDLDQEKDSVREAYGHSGFGRGTLLARRLVEHGVRFVQVSQGGFDTHSDNFTKMREIGSVIDPAIACLIRDLASSGLLEKTLVVQLSEFGRTPRINGEAGRDHHPRVFSALFAGGGVKPGLVIGSSDEDGVNPAERPVRISDIPATILAALGVDPTKHVTTPIGRPMKLVNDGQPVNELMKSA